MLNAWIDQCDQRYPQYIDNDYIHLFKALMY